MVTKVAINLKKEKMKPENDQKTSGFKPTEYCVHE